MGMKPGVPMSRKGLRHHIYPFISLPSQHPNHTPVATIAVPKKRPTTDTRGQQSRLRGVHGNSKGCLALPLPECSFLSLFPFGTPCAVLSHLLSEERKGTPLLSPPLHRGFSKDWVDGVFFA